MRVPLAVPNLSGNEAAYLQECVESTFVSTAGPFVGRFAAEIAEVSGAGAAVATCTGTVAIQMALEACGVQRDDLVLVPSLTFIASANAIRHAGADPWLVDCRADTWTIDLDAVESMLRDETEEHPRGRRHVGSGRVVSALVPVMTMGAAIDLEAHVRCAREFGLRLVVDAAAAIGATSTSGRGLAASGADAVCFSFNGNKVITSGGGGAVVSDDTALIERIDHLISTARTGSDYDHDAVGYNFRITNVEAAIGLAQIEQLPSFLQRKREVYLAYGALADEFSCVSGFPTPSGGTSTHWFSGVFFDRANPEGAVSAARFRRRLVDAGVDARPFWKPVHLQPPYADAVRSDMSVSESIWERIVPLPCSTGITDDQLEFVVDAARAALETELSYA